MCNKVMNGEHKSIFLLTSATIFVCACRTQFCIIKHYKYIPDPRRRPRSKPTTDPICFYVTLYQWTLRSTRIANNLGGWHAQVITTPNMNLYLRFTSSHVARNLAIRGLSPQPKIKLIRLISQLKYIHYMWQTFCIYFEILFLTHPYLFELQPGENFCF